MERTFRNGSERVNSLLGSDERIHQLSLCVRNKYVLQITGTDRKELSVRPSHFRNYMNRCSAAISQPGISFSQYQCHFLFQPIGQI